MFSNPVRGKSKMSWLEYYVTHVFPTGWRTITSAFRIWCDLMTENYDKYTLLKSDDPLEECRGWFWTTLGDDDILSKEFLEYLYQLSDDIDSGKEKLIPIDETFFNELDDLILDLESKNGNV